MKYDGELFVKNLLEIYGKEHNVSKPQQKELAIDLGIKEKTISNWKKGDCPNGATLKLILEKYDNLSLDFLFGNNEDNYFLLKKDLLKIMKEIMIFDFRQRRSFYAGYDISFNTNECEDGTLESTITFKLQNHTKHDYVHDLFNNYSSLQDFLIKMDSEHNPNYIADELYLEMINDCINKAEDQSEIDFSKYIKNGIK